MRVVKMTTTSVDVYDAARTLLAVRRYKAKRIPKDLVRKIVEAGRLTASSVNLQPWHFIVVEDVEMLRKLGAASRTGPYIAGAPLAIAVAVEKASEYGSPTRAGRSSRCCSSPGPRASARTGSASRR